MASSKPNRASDLTGCRVLIIGGNFAGREGICVGRSVDGERWAISPDGSDDILDLRFEAEFGLLVDLSGEPGSS